MPATAISDVSTASLTLQNTTPDPQTFEFRIPQGSDMTLSPHVGNLPAGATMRVLLRYCPRAETDPPCPGAEPGQPWSPQAGLQPSLDSTAAAAAEEAAEDAEPSSSGVSQACPTAKLFRAAVDVG